AGDERGLRHVAEVLRGPGRRLFLGRTADLADQHDRLGLGVLGKELEDVEERRPDDRVAADADAGRLAEAGVAHRLDGLVGQRPGAADDAHAAFAVDRARDDPDLGTPRGRRAGTVGADQPGAGLAHDLDRRDHVERRDALGDAEDRLDPRVCRLHHRIRCAGGRDEDAGRVRAGLADRVDHGVEHGDAAVDRGLATLAGRHPGNDRRAVLEHRPGVEFALAAGDAVDEQPRVGPDEDAHAGLPAASAAPAAVRLAATALSRATLSGPRLA